jgi:hypothetical protein
MVRHRLTAPITSVADGNERIRPPSPPRNCATTANPTQPAIRNFISITSQQPLFVDIHDSQDVTVPN